MARHTAAAAVLASLILSCSGGGGSGGAGSGFVVSSIDVPENSVQRINRPIRITFSQPVNFSTVNLNTVNIREVNGAPTAGTFGLENSRTVVFQPVCPTMSDFSDAGLRPGGVRYRLTIVGATSGAQFTVRSRAGEPLRVSETRNFSTPNSTNPSELFFDVTAGPPAPVLREVGSTELDATYIEIGGDPLNRFYFERDLTTGDISINPPLPEGLPLNTYSDQGTQVAIVLAMNQPINPSETNISQNAARLEFLGAGGVWRPIATEVELVGNCTGRGAQLRLEPIGILPPSTDTNDAMVRTVITTLLQDLVGETNLVQLDSFALSRTEVAPDELADQFMEEFEEGGVGTLEDVQAALVEPRARWGDGVLAATFEFDGTGGPNGNFDWRVPGPTGSVFPLSTSTAMITGGPGFSQTQTQIVTGGVIDVRNFEVPEGVTLKCQGPNPVTIFVSGTAVINGKIEVAGDNNLGANNVATANIPERGSPGQCGGGSGGDASPLTTMSDPIGLPGFGAFGAPSGGGGPGETGWSTSSTAPSRRGAGGGGGRLGSDQLDSCAPTVIPDQTMLGLDVEEGQIAMSDHGGLDNPGGAGRYDPVGGQGGAAGPGPFFDPDQNNNFFGTRVDTETMPPTVIEGELDRPWAGAGGGGAGDAVRCPGSSCTFPPPGFNLGNNQKGGAGGGGGGSLQIVALGDITFGPNGLIFARGGFGGHGESIGGVNNTGGGGGGGSGGHVILQTAGEIDFSAINFSANPNTPSGYHVAINATGGQGGSGFNNLGGAGYVEFGDNQITEKTGATQDNCPLTSNSNMSCTRPDGPRNTCMTFFGAGGDGGPGIVQLHTENGLADIILPASAEINDVSQPHPLPPLQPAVSRRSAAQSLWIPLGNGGFNADAPGTFRPVVFNFGGTDPMTGEVLKTGDLVMDLPDLLGPEELQNAPPALPHIDPTSSRTLVMDASSLVGTPEAQNSALLEGYVLELFDGSAPSDRVRFTVASAEFVDTTAPETIRLTVLSSDPILASFQPDSGQIEVRLIPAFFRVESQGEADSLPGTSAITFLFEATTATSGGLPDQDNASGFVSDLNSLNPGGSNNPTNLDWRFVRFQSLFQIAEVGQAVTLQTPRPRVRFLSVPFSY